jgi:CHAT domain-containing protein/Tfp pilus assembly protein PilF
MQSLLIVALCIAASVVYGVMHDQVTVRVCVEYFTVGHPPVFATDDLTLLGLGWGVLATWWVGLVLGTGLAFAARAGRRPGVSASALLRPVGVLLAVMAAGALAAGAAGWVLARAGVVSLSGWEAEQVPAGRHAAFLADLWAHTASYLVGFFGGCAIIARVWVSRGKAIRPDVAVNGQHPARSKRLLLAVLLAGAAPLLAQDIEGGPELNALLRRVVALEKAGKTREAISLREKLLDRAKRTLGSTHATTTTLMNDLAVLYFRVGEYAKALPLLQHGLEINEARRGKDHLDVATSLNNLAAVHRALGDNAKALSMLQRSLTIRERSMGRDDLSVAVVLNNLGEVCLSLGRHSTAESMHLRSLQIKEAKLGKDDPSVADSLNNLAFLYMVMGRHGKAEPLFQRSMKIREARLGKDHPATANSLHNLAGLYWVMGRPAKAEPLFRRSLAIREAKLGGNHPDTASSLHNLAALCAARDNAAEAAGVLDRGRRAARRHLASVLPALSDADRAAFFRGTTARTNLEMALSLGLAHKSDPVLTERSAAWLVNGKAIDQESLASSLLLTRQSNDPTLGKRAAQLLAVRQELARLTLASPQAGEGKQRLRQIDELTAREQDLACKLRQAGSRAAPRSWVELAALRRALPDDAVLIDVACFRNYDFKSKAGEKAWQEGRCAAWVTAKTGPARLVDLGSADRIDQAVQRFREAMKKANRTISEQGEGKAEQGLRPLLDVLARRVLAPLLPHIEKSKRWLISPDGNLWLLPWEVLTLSDGRYAIERHEIHYLTSGRDLLNSPAAKVTPGAALMLADPDFDLGTAKAGPETKRLVSGAITTGGTRSLAGVLRLGRVRPVSGTALEATAIAPSLKEYTGTAPRVYLRERAVEGVVKAARSPRVLVLCTHGFFLPDQQTPHEDRITARRERKWENPLLRCGLLLAGCNNAARVKGGDDGVLTGLEVVGLDLGGTELVVLSACDTGVGEVQQGEGVAGLRQAFQLAGAQAVVSTLWQVPDQSSAGLMAFFFDNLRKGMSKADALRAAKLRMVKERRGQAGAAHPFFWAAFTVTGQP